MNELRDRSGAVRTNLSAGMVHLKTLKIREYCDMARPAQMDRLLDKQGLSDCMKKKYAVSRERVSVRNGPIGPNGPDR
jgi:hypothetical protein